MVPQSYDTSQQDLLYETLCLPKGIPQRVMGKVNANINLMEIKEQELHCYVVTEDGRAYTAISK